MPVDARELATDVLRAGYHAGGALTATFDVGGGPDEVVQQIVDCFLADRETYKMRLRGIRTDTVGFAKFGIQIDRGNSGLYKGVPVVIAEVPFDTMEFVFGPELA